MLQSYDKKSITRIDRLRIKLPKLRKIISSLACSQRLACFLAASRLTHNPPYPPSFPPVHCPWWSSASSALAPPSVEILTLSCRFIVIFFVYSELIVNFVARINKQGLIMEANKTTFNRPSHDEVRQMFLRAKARQKQLEEEGRRMWEEEQKMKAEAKKYYELEFA
jgi:hypothetical protein